ncbi:Metallo-peptidase family M12-domain-containing protein [Phialemonium atrogriseum]|uniref:Disintegrin and metalloproteinase domain-containing protein B n=1 Tax=Phialemonium atrogriseum TaxID=1093897 RepID=A0AAJ0CDR0_9PEZI|nr:Metallo-peptidase family M12-domain-containing protein [Phialemonium atrogriseum]KAK1772446.1 Metallo-peptidase family M12-domain-containing protein [Phialemonium atrogriseum]
MYTPRALVAALSGFVLLFQFVIAHSIERRALSHVNRIDDAVIHTPSHRVHPLSSFDLTFHIHGRGQEVRLSVSPNHDVIAENAFVQYIDPDGSVRSEPIDRSEHRVYRGDAFVRDEGRSEWTSAGWARITVHRDGASPVFEGAFRVHGDDHHIHTSADFRQTRVGGDPDVEDLPDESMVVWRDSDIMGMDRDELKRNVAAGPSCSSDVLRFNRDDEHPVYRGPDGGFGTAETSSLRSMSARSLFGRQIDGTTGGNGAGVNLVSTIGSTAGCPTTRKVALIGVATDCTYTAKFNSSASVRTHIIKQINLASQVYESSFNISLGIQNLTISNAECPTTATSQVPWNVGCGGGTTITDRLNLFSQWRGQFSDTNAFWTLLSTCNTDAAVGLAWLGQVCVQGSQTASAKDNNETIAATNVVVMTSTEWQVIAHETGHTFGAVHDCTADTCSDGTVTKQQCCPLSKNSCDATGQFIMNPSTGNGITKFSPCSIGNICSAIGRNSVKASCLTNNRDVRTITGSQCGNGIVESGEDCDCGGDNGCTGNTCCDAKTCKFTANSVCDPANEECCTTECRFANNGTICRPSTGVCDPQETCTGTSALCPSDVTAPDGQSCGDKGASLKCSSGQCTSRDLQCKTLMGGRTSSNDTYACSSQGCQLSCASPEFGPSTCLTMQQNFLDGTTCQGGGKCSNGVCKGSNLSDEILGWIKENKPIFIPVVVVVGGLILLAILSCCVSAFRRGGKKKGRGGRRGRPHPPAPPPGWTAYGGAWGGGPGGGIAPPPPVMVGARPGGRSRPNLGPFGAPPPYQPPAPGQHQQGDMPWQPVRTLSARYA